MRVQLSGPGVEGGVLVVDEAQAAAATLSSSLSTSSLSTSTLAAAATSTAASALQSVAFTVALLGAHMRGTLAQWSCACIAIADHR